MHPSDWAAGEWAAFGSVSALFVYVILGITAIVQLRESRRLRELQTRPYVIVDFEFKGWWTHLVVKNIGATPAANVSITFDKKLQVPGKSNQPEDFEIFNGPIPMIAPGRVIKVRFGAGPDFFKDEAADIPLNYRAQAVYTDLSGKKKYQDPPLVLDLLPYKHTVVGSDHFSELATAAKGIEKAMKGWTHQGGLTVRAINQDKRANRDSRADYRYEARRVLRELGMRRLVNWQLTRWKRRLSD